MNLFEASKKDRFCVGLGVVMVTSIAREVVQLWERTCIFFKTWKLLHDDIKLL